MVLSGVVVLGGCSSNGDQQDNRANAIEVNSSVVEVDTLPPDESSATPNNQLINGVDAPLVSDESNTDSSH